MMSCGEPSGDAYAAALARELRALEPDVAITGLGGSQLRAAGATLVGEIDGLSVTGLLEVVPGLGRTYAMYRRLVAHARAERPDVFVAIDFPDFNFILARAVAALRIPIVYYVSPQLWAWRPGRMKTLRRIADKVLVIFPFEEQIYRDAGVPVEWVGHPLLDLMPPPRPRDVVRAGLGLTQERQVVALLPGSRPSEVSHILPGLVQAAALIRSRLPATQFILARAPHIGGTLLEPLAALAGDPVSVVADRAAEVLSAADVALVASGTITVQAALHACPMVVVYRLAPWTYRLGRPFVKVTTFAMANLVAGRRVVPELIQDDFVPARVAEEALRILTDPVAAARVRSDLADVRTRLGQPGASRRAARAVIAAARAPR